MRMLNAMGAATFILAASASGAWAEDVFDACEVFTQEDATKILGVPASPEPVNPKAKRPKVIPVCTYFASKDGKPVLASAQFRFGKTEPEAQRAFEEARMQFQTKPLLISGAEAFWAGKSGQLNLRKARTWITVAVGPDKVNERDMNEARKLAEMLAKKL